MASAPPHPVGADLLPCARPFLVLEFWWDPACPYTKKAWHTLTHDVLPWIVKAHPGRVRLTLQPAVQAWHPVTCVLSESCLAVRQLGGESDLCPYFSFLDTVFRHQEQWSDGLVYDFSRKDQHARIAATLLREAASAKPSWMSPDVQAGIMGHPSAVTVTRGAPLAASLSGPDQWQQVLSARGFTDMLHVATTDRTNAVTAHLRAVVRQQRERTMHVTPSLVVNGIRIQEFDSSWDMQAWRGLVDQQWEQTAWSKGVGVGVAAGQPQPSMQPTQPVGGTQATQPSHQPHEHHPISHHMQHHFIHFPEAHKGQAGQAQVSQAVPAQPAQSAGVGRKQQPVASGPNQGEATPDVPGAAASYRAPHMPGTA